MEISYEEKLVIKNFAVGKQEFKEEATSVYEKYKALLKEEEYPIEMLYMKEVLSPVINYTAKELLRGKLLNIKQRSKKEGIF